MSRVHSGGLPERHAAVLAEALGDVEHVPGSSALAAAADSECVAFVGPLRSWPAAHDAPILSRAGIVQVCPSCTWAALTRDEPAGFDAFPDQRASGRPTLVRLVARDTEVCRKLVANAPERRLAVVAEHEGYGQQLAEQLRLVGLRERPGAEPDAVVYCGVARNAPHGLLGRRRVYAFDGAQGFGDAETRYVLPVVPLEGWTDADVLAFVPPFQTAGELLRRAVRGDREATLRAVWELGGFDDHGDPVDPPVGLWRLDGARLVCEAVW